jgi:hypothetical protein
MYHPVPKLTSANDPYPGPPTNFIGYAPTLRCGPPGTKFDTPVTVKFGHCAYYDASKGPSGLFAMRRKNPHSPWQAMPPDLFVVNSKTVKVKLHELCELTLGFPLRGDS